MALSLAVTACGDDSTAEAPPPTIAATWRLYGTIDEMAQLADLVVVVEMGAEMDRLPVMDDVGTVAGRNVVHSAKVLRVLRGEDPGPEIRVAYPQFEGVAQVENVTPFTEGERLVLFMAAVESGPRPVWGTLSADSGVFEFVDDATVVNRGVVGAIGGQTFSLEDLVAKVEAAG